MNQKIAEIKSRQTKIAAEEKKEEGPKQYEENEASLSTRYCPEHPGVPVIPKGEGVYQCSLDGKSYDFKNGFTTQKGNKVPGTCVENQTKLDTHFSNPLSVSDTRDKRTGG